jgi:hypothetical protein
MSDKGEKATPRGFGRGFSVEIRGASSESRVVSNRVKMNYASVSELQLVPHIGSKIAGRIEALVEGEGLQEKMVVFIVGSQAT